MRLTRTMDWNLALQVLEWIQDNLNEHLGSSTCKMTHKWMTSQVHTFIWTLLSFSALEASSKPYQTYFATQALGEMGDVIPDPALFPKFISERVMGAWSFHNMRGLTMTRPPGQREFEPGANTYHLRQPATVSLHVTHTTHTHTHTSSPSHIHTGLIWTLEALYGHFPGATRHEQSKDKTKSRKKTSHGLNLNADIVRIFTQRRSETLSLNQVWLWLDSPPRNWIVL